MAAGKVKMISPYSVLRMGFTLRASCGTLEAKNQFSFLFSIFNFVSFYFIPFYIFLSFFLFFLFSPSLSTLTPYTKRRHSIETTLGSAITKFFSSTIIQYSIHPTIFFTKASINEKSCYTFHRTNNNIHWKKKNDTPLPFHLIPGLSYACNTHSFLLPKWRQL